MRHPFLAFAAAAILVAAALAAGYLAAGTTGLLDAAAVATLGGLLLVRGTVPGEKPRLVRPKRTGPSRRSAVRAAEFPAYRRIATDLEWAQMSRRHYEHALRPMLARLAATLDQRRPLPAELTRPPSGEVDSRGVGPATLERIIADLEDRWPALSWKARRRGSPPSKQAKQAKQANRGTAANGPYRRQVGTA